MQIHGRYKEHSGLLKTNLIQDKFLPFLIKIQQQKCILTHFPLNIHVTYKKIVASRTAPLFDFVASRTVK